MKRTNLIRGVLILAIAAFCLYRYVALDSAIYLVGIGGFLLLGGLSLADVLSSRWQNITLNVGITWFFLDLVFATIDLTEVAAALAQANYWWLIPSGLLVIIHLYFRAIRWQWLLKPMGEVRFWPAFNAMSIGLAGNILLPARAGEFLRAYVLGRSTGLRKTGAFATLVVERIFDGLTVVAFLVVTILIGVGESQLRFYDFLCTEASQDSPFCRNIPLTLRELDLIQGLGILGFIVYIVLLVGIIIFVLKRHWADNLINLILPTTLAERVLHLLDGFSSGLDILKNPSQLVMVILLSLATWIFIPLSFWAALLAFDFGTFIPWQTSAIMFPVVALGLTLVPGTPGGVGWFQYGVVLSLEATVNQAAVAPNFGEVAAAASIVVHVAQLIPQLITGFIGMWAEGLSATDLTQQAPPDEVTLAAKTQSATNHPD